MPSSNSITVNVRRKHIKNGKRGECRLCPVALALSDAGFFSPSVGVQAVYFYKKNEHWRTGHTAQLSMFLPKKVSKFIIKFDNVKTIKPFSFKLRVSRKLVREREVFA